MTNNAVIDLPDAGTVGPQETFWSRIAAELAAAIGEGRYLPGQRLPSEHALATSFGVNRHTIRRSLSSLAARGLVRISQGSGTYVDEFAVDLLLGRRPRHHQSLAQAGLRGGFRLLSFAVQRANAQQAAALQIAARGSVLCLQVLGDAEGTPLHTGERFFPLPRFKGLERHLRESGSITAALAACGVADYTRRESRMSAELPGDAVADNLRQPRARPVLFVESINVDAANVPIEFARTWFAGDRVKLTVKHDG